MKILQYDREVNRTAKFLDSFPDGGLWEIGVGILQSPLLAFRFAQVWERANMEGEALFEMGRLNFADSLHRLTQLTGDDHPMNQGPNGSSMKALDSYLEVVSRLLKRWRACDQDPVRWCTTTENQEELHLVQSALASTVFSLQLGRSREGAQATPPWSSMTGESMWSKKLSIRQKVAAFEAHKKAMNMLAPKRVVKSMPLLRERVSLIEAARTMAYLLFSEVLVQGIRVRFCTRCDAAFLPGKKQKYCSTQCAHVDSGSKTKIKQTRKLNRDRVRVTSQEITAWINSNSKRDWRLRVENALAKKNLTLSVKGKSQWLGRCIRAAGSEGGPQRARLTELCTGPGASEEETEKVSKDLITFYALIRQAQRRENRK